MAEIPNSAQPNLEQLTIITLENGLVKYGVDHEGQVWAKARPVFAEQTMTNPEDESQWPWTRLESSHPVATKVLDEWRRKARLGELKSAA